MFNILLISVPKKFTKSIESSLYYNVAGKNV